MSELEEAPAEPERRAFEFPSTMTVLILVTLIVWIAAFLIPSGTYQHDENGVPVPGSVSADRLASGPRRACRRLLPRPLLMASTGSRTRKTGVVHPFGVGRLFGAVGVFAFVLAIGAFMTMVLATGALDVAIGKLAYAVRARPWLVIVAVMALFSLLGTTMVARTRRSVFYALLIPLMLTLGLRPHGCCRDVDGHRERHGRGDGVDREPVLDRSRERVRGCRDRGRNGSPLDRMGRPHIDHDRVRRLVRGARQGGAGRARWWASRPRTGREADEGAVVGRADAHRTGRSSCSGSPRSASRFWSSPSSPGIRSSTSKKNVDPYTHQPIPHDPWWNLGWWFPELTALFLVAAVVVGLVAGYGEKEITGHITQGFRDFIGAGSCRHPRPRCDGDPEQHADDRHDPPLDGGRCQWHELGRLHLARDGHQHWHRVHRSLVFGRCHARDAAARAARRLRRRFTAACCDRLELGRRPSRGSSPRQAPW